MYRLVAIAVFWAAAVLPQTAFAQSHGVRSAGPVGGMRMSPSARAMHMGGGPGFAPGRRMGGPAFGPGVRMRGPGFGPGVRMRGPGFAPGRRMGGPGFGPPVRMSPVGREDGILYSCNLPSSMEASAITDAILSFSETAAFFGNRCFNDPFCRPFFRHRPFVSSAFFVPLYSGFPDYAYEPQDYGPSQAEVAQESDLERRIEFLTEEVARLRAESEERREPTPAAAPPIQPSVTEFPISTVLVFRNGHRETVHNYAVAGKTLWAFTEHRARKISISELDLAATKKVNSERGAEFLLPGLR